MPPLQKGMNEMLSHFGYPSHTVEELLQWVNWAPRAWVGGALPEGLSDEQFERCFAEYNRCYEKYYLETEYYPGFGELIARLKADGVKTAMLSNKQHKHVVALARKLSGVPASSHVVGITSHVASPARPPIFQMSHAVAVATAGMNHR